MATCCNKFVFNEVPDTFQMWQGLRGPYFTPHVAENGDLSWSNNGQLPNPETVNIKGPPGPGGVPGGTTGQLLAKASDEDYDTEWIDPPDLDAGHVEYDPAETYDDGSVGKELTTINSALSSLSSVTEIIDTASGAIASFTDGSGLPMRSLVAEINPVQDLHGQPNPYPAGGGKNKLNNTASTTTESGITFTVNDDGTITVTGTATATAILVVSNASQIGLVDGTSYILNGCTSGSGSTYKLDILNNVGTPIVTCLTGDVSFTKSETLTGNIRIVVYSGTTMNNVVFKPMIRLSTASDATYAPYANLCPISGHTGLSVEVTGFNVWDEEWETGIYSNDTGAPVENANRIRSKNHIQVKPSTTYYLYCGNSSIGIVVHYFKADGTQISQAPVKNATFTTPANTAYILFNTSTADLSTYNNDISINYPSTDTTYHAYTGTTTTVSWQDEAGTVYGGSDEVVGGELTSTMGEVDLGTLTWYYNTSQKVFFSAPIEGIKKYNSNTAIPNWICSSFPVYSLNIIREDGGSKSIGLGQGYQSAIDLSNCQCVRDDRFTDPNAFKNAMSGVKLVYELATPQTYQLTPQQVSTLLGQNNVWHDANGDTTVTYQASIKGYIDKVLGS